MSLMDLGGLGLDELLTRRLRAAGLGGEFCQKEATLRGKYDEVADWLSTKGKRGTGYDALVVGQGVRILALDKALMAREVLALMVRAAVLNDVDSLFFSSPVALMRAMDRDDAEDLEDVQLLAVDNFQIEGECPLTRREVFRVQDLLLGRDDNGRALAVTTELGELGPDSWWPDATRELVQDLKTFRV